MGLVYVQRYGIGNLIANTATQFITGALTINGPMVIELDPTVFAQAGNYLLFQYDSLVGNFSDISVDASDTGLTATLVNISNQIIVSLS